MASSGDDAPLAAPRVPTAAEKRAARRARVLESGERRLKLLTGEIGSLKPENEAVEKAMDEGIAELLDATELPTELPTPVAEEAEAAAVSKIKIPSRVDPAQRRRDAQARRQKKEAMVQEILSGGSSASTTVAGDASVPPPSASTAEVHADTTTSVRKELSEKRVVEPAFSRHALALRLRSAEEKLILVAIVGAALYMAFATDLRNVTTDLLTSNPLFLSYQQLVANGVSLEAIRQQMQRENLEPVLMDQIERVFVSQRKSEHLQAAAASASLMRSLVPNFADLPGFFASWLSQPPIILCVLLLRVLVGLLGGALHTLFKLPEVTTPKDDDLGFVANLALSSRPALKEYVVKTRKSVDDVFLFLWSFVLGVAARSVVAAHAG